MSILPLTMKERLVLISGMGADERLFIPQWAHGFEFDVPAFPMPDPDDDMADYARRIREQLELDGPCVVGGVSFGGMLACELARCGNVRCVIQIASCRDGAALPAYFHLAEWSARYVTDDDLRQRALTLVRMFERLEPLTPAQQASVDEMAASAPVHLLRQMGRMILRWKAPEDISCPVYHIHGALDRLIPLNNLRHPPNEVIDDGGHLINMTHADRVNRFIERCLESGD